MSSQEISSADETSLSGIIASKGLVLAKAAVITVSPVSINTQKISPSDVDNEIQRFQKVKDKSIKQLKKLHEKAIVDLGNDEANIFDGFVMILEDEELEEDIIQFIKDNLQTSDFATNIIMQENITQLQALDDTYLKTRAEDMDNLLKRMIHNFHDDGVSDFDHSLCNVDNNKKDNMQSEKILVAENISPSQMLQINLNNIKGIITAEGGGLSHTAILAKSLGLPAVVNCNDCLSRINDDDVILLDAENNSIIVNPNQNTLNSYQPLFDKNKALKEKLEKLRDVPAQTQDGFLLKLYANIGTINEIDVVKQHGIHGIGLFRTEFLFMDRDCAPTENEQFDIYRKAAEKMEGNPVVIRTLDIGGDKDIPYLELPQEMNPFLGKRAIRLCFERPELLITQLRAVMRASVYGKIKIMFPMVVCVEEVRKLRTILNDVIMSLDSEQIPVDKNVEVGIMVETPAAVIMAEELIKELDFFSIGSNDLTQYVLAVDRCNPDLAYMYDSLHPSVLRSIKWVVDAVHREGKWVGVCGEMASCDKASLVLLGLGVDELSISAPSAVRVKESIVQYSKDELKEMAAKIVQSATRDDVECVLNNFIKH